MHSQQKFVRHADQNARLIRRLNESAARMGCSQFAPQHIIAALERHRIGLAAVVWPASKQHYGRFSRAHYHPVAANHAGLNGYWQIKAAVGCSSGHSNLLSCTV
jgi:hypothetical protein